ncbi:hypothetical protein D9611_002866 [Ephemerocybe angulata]|uniref:ATP-dependent DNA helicase n=1 Tax=Ephemerocybe angulata TaxID=980116 RepID=A0A8H5C813_9AGAR|nr:hypothetical protein D9611_002866 [Tulosesus angulatus]
MLSATDLYRISERLCRVLNYAEQSFGGLNMIFAGDFAQLPPAVGGETVSLYGRIEGRSGDVKVQKNVIGRSLWHEVTTVVMLKQNMRQTNKSIQDTAYRRALQNMRYKACDWEDIAFLRSRITSSVPGCPSIVEPNFRNVSVITTKNAIKDVMNDVGSKRFAAEAGTELTYFYSEDEISRESGNTSRKRVKKRMLLQAIEPTLQHDLWHQPPSTVKGHIPGRLGLCIGLPVLIKHNEATELGITNGQEGFVYGWQAGKGSRGQPILDVLFVELKKPPKEVRICDLPVNVVPLLPSTTTQLDCTVKGGLHVLINRTQVEVLPNFAMTDFASQGKTREYNVIDLAPCLTHQSMYTALSRGCTAEGTIILRDFPAGPIMGGLRRNKQMQEFRCLELLGEITDLRYNGALPVEVFGMYRKELIESYRKWKGNDHVPASIPKAIRWGPRDPWMDDPEPVKWRIVDASKDNATDTAKNKDRTLIAAQGSQALKRKCVSSPDADSKPTRKRARTAKTATQSRHAPTPISLVGPSWSNNSCPYDSLLVILANLWKEDWDSWRRHNALAVPNALGSLALEIGKFFEGRCNLETARDRWRVSLASIHPGDLSFGVYASVAFLIEKVFVYPRAVYTKQYFCPACDMSMDELRPDNPNHRTKAVYHCQLELDTDEEGLDLQTWVCGYSESRNHNSTCSVCARRLHYRRRFSREAKYLFIALSEHEHISINTSIDVTTYGHNSVVGCPRTFALRGLIYYGDSHFTSRLVQDDRVWFHDGVHTGSVVIPEGSIGSLGPLTLRDGKKLHVAVYTALD